MGCGRIGVDAMAGGIGRKVMGGMPGGWWRRREVESKPREVNLGYVESVFQYVGREVRGGKMGSKGVYGVELLARRAVKGDQADKVVPGEGCRNGKSEPREDFLLIENGVIGGKEDSDTTLGAAPGARGCRTVYKGCGGESRFPQGSVSEAPVRFL